ncbi:MAG: hypothetical protein KKD77_20065, partial [Gammaproteobacteria bacterium]|nr:hypothetical protein [Gammaproteobacteria bacterium]
IIKPRALQADKYQLIMDDMAKKRKTIKPDYIYQCQPCNGSQVHRSEPSNEPCVICEKRMTLIKIVNVPNIKPLKPSDHYKLATIKSSLKPANQKPMPKHDIDSLLSHNTQPPAEWEM